LFRVKKNILGKFDDMREHFALKKNLRRANIITYAAELSRGNLHNYYKGEVISLCMGINFDYWKRRTDKLEVKKKLGLVQKNSILLSTSRLNSAKQVDRVINILKKFDNSDFLYIVTGHGENKYEQYLQNLGESLEKAGKLRFIGYVSEKHLIDLYTAADLFIMSSRSEGGPTATIKAAAMETPIFTTDTGQIAELLEKYDAGVVVPANDYKDWEKELAEILNGKKIKVLDRDIAESVFHWPNVAAHYVRLYERLFESYYGNKWQRMGQ
jgi:glycosyltransferase involved in cell wall biosynthesis